MKFLARDPEIWGVLAPGVLQGQMQWERSEPALKPFIKNVPSNKKRGHLKVGVGAGTLQSKVGPWYHNSRK